TSLWRGIMSVCLDDSVRSSEARRLPTPAALACLGCQGTPQTTRDRAQKTSAGVHRVDPRSFRSGKSGFSQEADSRPRTTLQLWVHALARMGAPREPTPSGDVRRRGSAPVTPSGHLAAALRRRYWRATSLSHLAERSRAPKPHTQRGLS